MNQRDRDTLQQPRYCGGRTDVRDTDFLFSGLSLIVLPVWDFPSFKSIRYFSVLLQFRALRVGFSVGN